MLLNKEIVVFSSLFPGDTFLYDDVLYMKCTNLENKNIHNAVNLNEGSLENLEDDAWVSEVGCEIKLIIDKKIN